MTLEYQFKKAFLEQEEEKFIDYLCDKRTKQEVVAAIEKIALINLEIKIVRILFIQQIFQNLMIL